MFVEFERAPKGLVDGDAKLERENATGELRNAKPDQIAKNKVPMVTAGHNKTPVYDLVDERAPEQRISGWRCELAW